MKKSYRRSITIGLLMSVFIFLCGMSACCPPININGSGPVTLLGNVCGEDVNLETRTGGAIASFEQCGELDNDIDVMSDYGEGIIGFQIENPELLTADTTFTALDLGLILEGDVIADNCGLTPGEDEISISSGSVFIEIYDGIILKGSFDIELNGENISGSFDIDFDESLEPYFD